MAGKRKAEAPNGLDQRSKAPRTDDKRQQELRQLIASLDSSDIITLHEKYDLTLVVGQELDAPVKAIRVHSAIMTISGDSFKAMLSGKF
ncbi:hypothetical protein BU23DRAFT_251835 [Bimuria novae-zelandiae CBS 107.79]|uniref:BTB domain-containing protein n=1 Tax=Bimuria novae-zelandiae CBS 107.79 TaxID=1447943 RepID=A0A6A5VML5_9PLEO|nr:hypothetical protein BU23DRAFT_251835 [Bimuria novae-zelandiae CBS 107.79]